MQVILRKDVQNVGEAGDVVTVKKQRTKFGKNQS